MSTDIKQATEAALDDGDLVWGSDVGETDVKVMTDVVGKAATQQLENKTLIAPTIATITTASGVITVPDATDTLVARDTVDILENKTLTSPVLTTPTIDSLTGATIASPTFSDYTIRTPQALTAVNAGTQGSGPITSDIAYVTVGAEDDVVTMPAAAIGRTCRIIQAPVGNRVKVFPASGDALQGVGLDTAWYIGAGFTATYIAISDSVWLRTDYSSIYPYQTITLTALQTSLQVLSPFIEITANSGGHSFTTLTGGAQGQMVTLYFRNMSGGVFDFESTDDTTPTTDEVILKDEITWTIPEPSSLTLLYNGTYWVEIARTDLAP